MEVAFISRIIGCVFILSVIQVQTIDNLEKNYGCFYNSTHIPFLCQYQFIVIWRYYAILAALVTVTGMQHILLSNSIKIRTTTGNRQSGRKSQRGVKRNLTFGEQMAGGSPGAGDADEQGHSNPNDGPPRKQTRPGRHNGSGCGDCFVWLQLGSDPTLRHEHPMKKVCHPNDQTDQFASYLSTTYQKFVITPDSCMCLSCYKDAHTVTKRGDKEAIPRWLRNQNDRQTVQKHCPVCHHDTVGKSSPDTPCKTETVRWAPENWMLAVPVHTWNEYFTTTRGIFYGKFKEASTPCYKHYMELYNLSRNRKCVLCLSTTSPKWDLAVGQWTKISKYCERLSLPKVNKLDWICMNCPPHVPRKTKGSGENLNKTDAGTIESKVMSETLLEALDTIKSTGFIMRKYVITDFGKKIDIIIPIDSTSSIKQDLIKAFDNFLTRHINLRTDIGKCDVSDEFVIGTMLYDTTVMSDIAAKSIYKILGQKELLEKKIVKIENNCVQIEDITDWVDKQTKIFTSLPEDIDLRNIVPKTVQDSYFLDRYLHKPLVHFLEKITCLKDKSTSEYAVYKNKLKIQMLIGILCNIRSNKSTLLQSMIGLAAYSGGIRDKVFEMLSMFGITCSITYIRNMADKWSKKRNVLDEIDKRSFWRVTFDNLNFLRKFSKTFKLGGQVAGRMLDLLTGQITHRVQVEGNTQNVHACQDVSGSNYVTCDLTEEDFFIKPGTPEEQEFNQFTECVYNTAAKLWSKSPVKNTLVEDLQSQLPSFTPAKGDNVAYARVSAARSSSIDDICEYLVNIKEDLNIGKEGFPLNCVVSGDQQTYSLMKNLITKYPVTFSWIIPVPGDWHLLKLAAETIKDMLWDGGFHDMARICGQHKEVHQWKDIHRIISGIHESLLRVALSQTMGNPLQIENLVLSLKSDKNNDEISRFWSSTFEYVHAYMGYYFSIRSGNWNLRNACLPKLT